MELVEEMPVGRTRSGDYTKHYKFIEDLPPGGVAKFTQGIDFPQNSTSFALSVRNRFNRNGSEVVRVMTRKGDVYVELIDDEE